MAEPRDDGYEISATTAILLTLASVLLGYLGAHFGYADMNGGWGFLSFLIDPGAVADAFLVHLFTAPFSDLLDFDVILVASIFFLLPWTIYFLVFVRQKRRYMYNKEHGSSRWATDAEAAKFGDATDPYNNIILSRHDRMVLIPRKFNIKYDRNKNVLLLGGPGSGKTRYNIKPALMQLNSSYVLTDPKATTIPETGTLFVGDGRRPLPDECKFPLKQDLYEYTQTAHGVEKKLIAKPGTLLPYEVIIINLKDFDSSMKYNPLSYMRKGKDILKLVNVLMKNTEGEGAQKGEDFWIKAEQLFYNALFAYLFYECEPEERTIPNLINLVDHAKAKEDDEEYKSPLDMLFEELETGTQYNQETGEWEQVAPPQPNHFAVRQYKKFKQAAGKTLKSILISCSARLGPFDLEELRDLLSADELELDKIGDRPTVFYMALPDTDSTFRFIPAMCFYQMFDLLVEHADNDCGGKLPIPVQCLFDEFANLGVIPDFDKLITTLRSRGISAEIVLQNPGQLDRDYDKAARIIKGACDTTIYLGGGDTETCEEISKRCGKATIANYSVTTNQGPQRTWSNNDQIIQRDLLTPDEVDRLDREQCLVFISGTYPRLTDKYVLQEHPRYKYIDPASSDTLYDKEFDARAYILKKRELAIRAARANALATHPQQALLDAMPQEMRSGVVFETEGVRKAREVAEEAQRRLAEPHVYATPRRDAALDRDAKRAEEQA